MNRSPQVELDLDIVEPVDNRLAILHRGPEAHLISGSNGLLVQAIRQPAHHDDLLDRAARFDEYAHSHHALNLIPARFFGVEGSWSIQEDWPLVNGFLLGVRLSSPSDSGPSVTDVLIAARTNAWRASMTL